jgi:molybdate transport system ATP-binding protein
MRASGARMLELSITKQLGPFAFAVEATLPSAGVVALFGRSGAGKTSLVNMLAGLLRPDSGRIAVAGRVLFDSAAGIDLAPERRRIGYVFQEGRLFPHLDVRANLLYGYRRIPPGERAIKLPEIVELLGIAHLLGRRPANLSGGEKQRVAIGRALLSNPRLLLLDEPLAALDAERKAEILPFIERLRDELGLPIVYVSHDPMEVLRLADRVLLLEQGRVAAAGPVSEVFGRPELQRLIGAEEAGTVLSAVVASRDETYGLSRLSFGDGGNLIVPDMGAAIGSTLRLRIRARDVSLARGKPVEISVLNNLSARIVAIHPAEGPYRDVEMLTAGVPLWARITARSVAELRLGIGEEVYALVKAVSIDRQAFTARPPMQSAFRAATD